MCLSVPFIWRSFHFFSKSFLFLFLFLCYPYFSTFLSMWSLVNGTVIQNSLHFLIKSVLFVVYSFMYCVWKNMHKTTLYISPSSIVLASLIIQGNVMRKVGKIVYYANSSRLLCRKTNIQAATIHRRMKLGIYRYLVLFGWQLKFRFSVTFKR